MARLKKLSLGALNIKIHPSSHKAYISLINALYRIREPVQIRGSAWGLIGALSEIDEFPIMGAFYRYLNIDPKEPWYNLIEGRPLATEHGEAIPVVADHLKPNFKQVPFLFYPEKHRLLFDLADISHNGAHRIIEALASQEIIRNEFGEVQIIIESSHVSLDRILSISSMTRLEIFLTRPNPDDLDGIAEQVQNRMFDMGLFQFNQVLTSNRNMGIKPDDQAKGSMWLALSNGHINAIGYEGERRVSESTARHPDTRSDMYNPGKEPRKNAMARIGGYFLDYLLKKLQNGSDSNNSY